MAMTKKTATKKTATKKTATKKTATKKAAKKKTATKKTATKKTATKKTATKKTAKKKTATKKAAKKKAATKKAATKKVRLRGTQHDPPVLVLVHLPMSLQPAERQTKFDDPLDLALGELGTITGGGASLGEDGAVESCDIELEVNDIARALPIVRRVLRDGGAAKGTLVARMTPGASQAVEVLFEL
jgi:cell wall-associated NlpC family hydrolase